MTLNIFTEALADFFQTVYTVLIEEHRYIYILQGLGNTLFITLAAVLIGVALGGVVALIRIAHSQNPQKLRIANAVCGLYLTVIRGTPVAVQLILICLVFFARQDVMLMAVITFGLNSGAYVAEVIRSGIQSVDKGQMEAGRSLGLNQRTTMIKIIFPQALKNVSPAIFNEFIALLKETSVAGFVGVTDLTRGGNIIMSTTYNGIIPMVAVAIIYLVIVIGLTALLHKLERRLHQSDKR